MDITSGDALMSLEQVPGTLLYYNFRGKESATIAVQATQAGLAKTGPQRRGL